MKRYMYAVMVAMVTAGHSAVICADEVKIVPPRDHPPRRVVIGTVIQGFWGAYPGVDERAAQLVKLIDRVHAASREKYGRNADLVVLPEQALTGGRPGAARDRSVAFEGALRDRFAAAARKHRSYLVLPLDLLEDAEKDICYNAAILLNREGETQGIYRKVHMVYDPKDMSLEGGMTPTWDVPVFDCDFGRLGIQICWDMIFDHNWAVLQRQGAEIVVWPTMAPHTIQPRQRAMQHRYYIVSSNWRDNATIFEPTGQLAAQVETPAEILVHEIDLSYAVIGWSPTLEDGRIFDRAFGDRIGYRYRPREDRGIFWSNDPKLTVGEALRQLGLRELHDVEAEAREVYRKWRAEAEREGRARP